MATKSNPVSTGSIIGMVLNLWTFSTLVLNITDTTHISWWLVFAPWIVFYGLGVICLLILGAVAVTEGK